MYTARGGTGYITQLHEGYTMTQTYTTNGNYTLLKKDEDGIMSLTLIHYSMGTIDTHCDGMTDADATSWFDYAIKQNEDLLYNNYVSTLDEDLQTSMYEMQEDTITLAHHEGVNIKSQEYISGGVCTLEYLVTVNNVVIVRGNMQSIYNHCITHEINGMVARWFNRNFNGITL